MMNRAKFIQEARRACRFRHDSVLELIGQETRLQDGAARLVDVSSMGASFTTTRVFAMGARIHARLRLFGSGVLEITGNVVRITPTANAVHYAVVFETVRGARP